jgi:hypothetical protein
MSIIDTIPDELKALHVYYLRASAAREDMLAKAKDAIPKDDGSVDLLAIMECDRRMSVFYGLVYVVVEGFRGLGLSDPKLDMLFTDPLLEKLRRYRNAIFHFQKQWFVSDKHMDFHDDPGAPEFMTSLWKEMNRWFSNHIARPVLEEHVRIRRDQPWWWRRALRWLRARI